MTDATAPSSLDGATRDALVELVIRGMHRGAVSPEQQNLVDAGLAMAKGPLIMPTPEGSAAAQQLTRLPAGGDDEKALRPLFEKFLPVNHELREICSAWQLRPDGSANDHGDPAYDASVRDRLDDVDDGIGRILAARTAEIQPRLGTTAPPSPRRWRSSTTATTAHSPRRCPLVPHGVDVPAPGAPDAAGHQPRRGRAAEEELVRGQKV